MSFSSCYLWKVKGITLGKYGRQMVGDQLTPSELIKFLPDEMCFFLVSCSWEAIFYLFIKYLLITYYVPSTMLVSKWELKWRFPWGVGKKKMKISFQLWVYIKIVLWGIKYLS